MPLSVENKTDNRRPTTDDRRPKTENEALPRSSALGLRFSAVALAAALGLWLGQGCQKPSTRPAADTRPHAVANPASRSVTVPAFVAKQDKYEELKGAIEYVLVSQGGKDYETAFCTDVPPQEIQDALLKVGLFPGQPAAEGQPPRGQPVRIWVELTGTGGQTIRRPIEDFVFCEQLTASMPAKPWPFTGSGTGVDPQTSKQILQAQLTMSIIGLQYADDSVLFQPARADAAQRPTFRINKDVLPPPGTPVRIIFEREPPRPYARRVVVSLAGRVQGLGYDSYIERQGRLAQVNGFVRNLAEDRLQVVAEGPNRAVEGFLAAVQRGPRGARVDAFEVQDQPPEGDFEGFGIWR